MSQKILGLIYCLPALTLQVLGILKNLKDKQLNSANSE